MAVDDARHDVLACTVDDARVCRRIEVFPDSRDFAVTQEHVRVLQRAARDGEHSGVADQRLGRCLFLRAGAYRQRRDDGDEKKFGDESFHCFGLSGAGLSSNGRPSMNTCVTRPLRSNKSPRTTVRFAIFPASIDPS